MTSFSCPDSNNSPVWTSIDVLKWKIVPERFGGGKTFIQRFKDGWVTHNRFRIRSAAAAHSIQDQLLAGTAWIEVGGDPTFIDRAAFNVRSGDWSGPPWVDKHLTVTRPPEMTSFGPVSMQLRTAVATMGLDFDKISPADLDALSRCLEKDVFNLNIVAKHLRALAKYDHPKADTGALTQDQIRVVGARYNRGKGPTLAQIKQNTSYGDFILKLWPRVSALLR